MTAMAWQWFLRLYQRGKDPSEFLTGFTTLLARAVNSGRRLVGMARSKKPGPRKAEAAPAPAAAGGKVPGIPPDDILYVKQLVGRLGAGQVHALIDAFAR
jgi:hypothetical protein